METPHCLDVYEAHKIGNGTGKVHKTTYIFNNSNFSTVLRCEDDGIDSVTGEKGIISSPSGTCALKLSGLIAMLNRRILNEGSDNVLLVGLTHGNDPEIKLDARALSVLINKKGLLNIFDVK